MIIGIHQPNYIPWIGYFYKLYKSDIFIILDDVQYVKNTVADRNKIKTSQGECYLKIPVEYKSMISKYNDVIVKDELIWRERHLKSIEMNYKKSKYFNDIFDDLNKIYLDKSNITLSKFNISVINYIVKKIGIETKIMHSSDFGFKELSKTEKLINLIKLNNGDVYLSGNGGKNYQDETEFYKNNIKLLYTDFIHPIYNQLWGEFIPNLSMVDLLFNYGCDSLEIIKNSFDNKI